MNKIYKPLILLLIFCANLLCAHTLTKYLPLHSHEKVKTTTIIVVDMGSTGTRMHAYSLERSQDSNIPKIYEIATSKSQDKRAIANYCNNPDAISEHITPLYNQLSSQLHEFNIDINKTPIYFLATAGMRLHNEQQQQQVHKQIVKTISNLGHDKNITAKTIPGELEGIFDWLSVNYKLNTLQNNTQTIAALDMGGASTQVSIEYNDHNINKKENNIYTLYFGEKQYHVYSKSILGYGLTQTKINLNNDNQELTEQQCNISSLNSLKPFISLNRKERLNAKNIRHYDFSYKKCSKLIKSYLHHKKEHQEIAKVVTQAIEKNMQIVAFSGYYYNFKFFNSNMLDDLVITIPDSCHDHREEFKKKFPDLTEEELNESCFNATYMKTLLNSGYKIPQDYKNFTIPKHDIDWTIGATLFITTEQDCFDVMPSS